jgi:uncharacterized protein (TIGR03663 family)
MPGNSACPSTWLRYCRLFILRFMGAFSVATSRRGASRRTRHEWSAAQRTLRIDDDTFYPSQQGNPVNMLRERTVEEAATTGPAERLARPLTALVRWDVEKLAWAALLIVVILSRTIALGQRAISFDESLHAFFSWKLWQGQGYQHQPLTHGPLKFELTAFIYFLLGANDWTARFGIALFGIALVWAIWWMRRWLGKTGAFLAATLCTISPALLFYSRYLRDEVALCALSVALVISIFRYLETRSARWLSITAVVLALAFTTTEVAFILGGLIGLFFLLVVALRLWSRAWPAVSYRQSYRLALSVTVAALLWGGAFWLLGLALLAVALWVLGACAAVLMMGLIVMGWGPCLRSFVEIDLIVLLAALVLPFLSGLVLKRLGWQVDQFDDTAPFTLAMYAQGGLVMAVLFALSALIGWFWLGKRWWAAAGLFWGIELLLFTTFLTNGKGVYTGVIGSLGYWIDQQAVRRGSQPWYYFLLLVPLYEFLPLLLSGAGVVAWLRARVREQPDGQTVERPQADASGMTRSVSGELVAFLVFWVVAVWVVFTYVGEKMPWHVVYFTTPMALLGGWWLGRVVDRIDWAQVRARGGFWLVGLLPVFLLALKATLPTSTYMPFNGVARGELQTTAQWLLALIVALALGVVIIRRVRRLGGRLTRRLVAVTLAAMLGVFTVAVAFRLALVNYDYATEPLVYAHGTPDLTLAMNQIARISRETSGDLSLQVAYDDDTAWPMAWYLRDYSNQIYYGSTPTPAAMSAPVIIVGDQNRAKVLPFLGNRYYEFNYRLLWWPRQTYFGLTWQRIWDGIRDPVQRGEFWNVVLYRRYTTPTAQWQPVHRFSLFVRKDVAAQVWDWAGATGGPATTK